MPVQRSMPVPSDVGALTCAAKNASARDEGDDGGRLLVEGSSLSASRLWSSIAEWPELPAHASAFLGARAVPVAGDLVAGRGEAPEALAPASQHVGHAHAQAGMTVMRRSGRDELRWPELVA